MDATLPEQRIVEAAALLRPGRVEGVTGWAALRWLGGRWFSGVGPYGRTRPVCLVREGLRPPPGVVISEEGLNPRLLLVHDGVAVTNALRSTTFEMRYAATAAEATVHFDMAAYDDLVSVEETQGFLPGLQAWTGVPMLREALPWVDENSWSPQETRMRWVWQVEAGLPRPLCNQPIFDRTGRHLATPDLLDLESGLVGEYDGEAHAEAVRRRSDRDRFDRYRELGLEPVVMMRGDAGDPGRLAARMLAAYRRARFEAESTRAWTIEPPLWWVPTVTVAQRRALDPQQRARLLRYRRGA